MNKLVGYHTINADPRHYSSNAIVGKMLQCKTLHTFKQYEKECKSAGCNCYNEETFNEYLDAEKIEITVMFLKGEWKAFSLVMYDNEILTTNEILKEKIVHFTIPASKYTKVLELAEKWQATLDIPQPPPKELNSKQYSVKLTWEQLENIFSAGYKNHLDGLTTPVADFNKHMLKNHNIKLTNNV